MTPRVTARFRCAQRLSASSEFSQGIKKDLRSDLSCSTPFGIIGILTFAKTQFISNIILVLNAFRHHRNSHSVSTSRFGLCFACSTPFGIIGILTRANDVPNPNRNVVLNAFRHHRNSHARTTANKNRSAMCSTPFGIIGILTIVDAITGRPQLSAQRLSASSEFSPGNVGRADRVRRVLNAFRHHRNSHDSNFRMGNEDGPSAQRLSASSEFSHPRGH